MHAHCSALTFSSPIQSRTPNQGMTSHTVGWAFLYQLRPLRPQTPHRSTDLDNPCCDCFQVILDCVKLTFKLTHHKGDGQKPAWGGRNRDGVQRGLHLKRSKEMGRRMRSVGTLDSLVFRTMIQAEESEQQTTRVLERAKNWTWVLAQTQQLPEHRVCFLINQEEDRPRAQAGVVT